MNKNERKKQRVTKNKSKGRSKGKAPFFIVYFMGAIKRRGGGGRIDRINVLEKDRFELS